MIRAASRPLVQLAADALDLVRPEVRTHWLDRVASLSEADVSEVLHRTPEMSEVRAAFLAEVVRINRRRLLDEC